MDSPLVGIVELTSGMAFTATAGSGHAITLDAAAEVGGADQGARPMELLLLGLGGCTGMDVISILRKMHQEVTGYQVRVTGDRAAEHPKVFTHIVVEHIVRGKNLNPSLVQRAVDLSATKYCSASAMLGKVATIEERLQLIEDTKPSGAK